MLFDDKFITYLEELSCLTLPADEKTHLSGQLQQVFDGVSRLKDLNTDGVLECSRPLANKNFFREDEVEPPKARELILRNAPQKTDEMFIAPRTVE